MTDQTALDAAYAVMEQDGTDDAARLRFFERLADSELFLLLTQEAEGEELSPELFDVADGRFVLVFDREERLASFAGRPAPYAALSGRVLVGMLAGQGIGLGLNLDVAPSAQLIPGEAVDWLMGTLQQVPDQVEGRFAELYAPAGLPDRLLMALDAKLATARGLAQAAYLVGVTYQGGGRGHLLAFVDAREGARDALAKAASEALTFSGIEAGSMDVGFFAATESIAAKLAQYGLRFDLPKPEPVASSATAPGMDPDRPPVLK
ncbi:MAG: SseB family protein [Paracoccaceae bacterium]